MLVLLIELRAFSCLVVRIGGVFAARPANRSLQSGKAITVRRLYFLITFCLKSNIVTRKLSAAV